MSNSSKSVAAVCLASLLSILAQASALAASPDGLYFMTRYVMGSSLEMAGWYFKNGQVTKRPTGDLSKFDFAAAAAADPNRTGTFTVAGNKMTIKWANGKSLTSEVEPDKGGSRCFFWDMGNFCPVQPFGQSVKLDGVFEGGASAGYGSVANVTQLTLRSDGTYKLDGVGSLTGKTSESVVSAGASGSESGTYTLSGTTLNLSSRKGKPILAFPYDDGSKGPSPRRMFFDATMLKRLK